MKLSVIIPAFHEPYLQRTVTSLLDTSELGGDMEVIVVLDGKWMEGPLMPDCRLRVVELPEHRGLRGCINRGIVEAKGEFLMKVDAHCAFSPGFDRIMVDSFHEDNWVLVPRRFALDEEKWDRTRVGHPRDYHYLNYPVYVDNYGWAMSAHVWDRRGQGPRIDDIMTFQGSCWMVNNKHFSKLIGFLDDSRNTYGPFWLEYMEVGLKYWLTGGANKVTKRCWYAHLQKQEKHYDSGDYSRQYKQGFPRTKYTAWVAKHWLMNEERGLRYSFQWLVEKFWPVPTWPGEREKWVI